MAMRQPGPGLPLGLGQELQCCSAIGIRNPTIACPALGKDGPNPQNCPDLPGGSWELLPCTSWVLQHLPSAFSLDLRSGSPPMTQHSRMSTGRLLEQNQKHVYVGKQEWGLGRVMSAVLVRQKRSTLRKHPKSYWCLSVTILAEPGCWERTLQKQQSAKMGFSQLLTAGSSFLSFFFTLAKPTLSLPSFSHPRLTQEGGEESSTPLLQRHRAPVGPGAETEYFGRGFLADPRLARP